MKKLLVVIDYQNDFVNGSLGFEKAVALEEYLVDLITFFFILITSLLIYNLL